MSQPTSPDFDIPARLRYAGVTPDTSKRLRSFWRVVRSNLPGLLNAFYNHVGKEPRLAALVGDQSARLKQAQSAHWERLFSGKFDQVYVEGVYRVGLAHKKIGMEPRWYIAGYQFVLSRLIRIAIRHYFWRPFKLAAVIEAINKAVMLDMDLAIFAYQDALEQEKAAQAELIVSSVGVGLSALAGGDLTHRISMELSGAFAGLKGDYNNALPKIQETMKSVMQSADTISTGAAEISAATDDLSQRTEHQAASLEQTAAAVEQITATVKKTAENAKAASAIVATAKTAAEDSGHVVETTISAMSQIEQSSKQITDIIGVIDEIAFQTNLLALNAGVEAARAGDAGRGFAVVASEVRALAQRSSQAAKEIKTLIKASSEHVSTGVKLVGDSGTALKRIVDEVSQINSLVTEMAQAAQQQSTGIEEVNIAINQMDQVTQQNAAMVEQSTAAARNLAGETKVLLNLVGFFQVGGHQRKASQDEPVVHPEPVKSQSHSNRPAIRSMGSRGRAATAVAEKIVSKSEEWSEF